MTLLRNTIESNDTPHPEISNVGGGVSSEDSDIRIIENVIRDNLGGRGGGRRGQRRLRGDPGQYGPGEFTVRIQALASIQGSVPSLRMGDL